MLSQSLILLVFSLALLCTEAVSSKRYSIQSSLLGNRNVKPFEITEFPLNMETTGIAPAPDTDKPVASNIGTEAFGSIARKLLFPVTSLFSSYNMLLTKYPLPTKITTSAIVGGAGDLLIQYMTMRKTGVMAAYAYRRMLVFATVCGLYYAPIVNLWYYLLTQLPLPKNTPYSKKVVAMVVVDQTAGSLSIVTGFFFAFELVRSH